MGFVCFAHVWRMFNVLSIDNYSAKMKTRRLNWMRLRNKAKMVSHITEAHVLDY